jgi:hypothetical protein
LVAIFFVKINRGEKPQTNPSSYAKRDINTCKNQDVDQLRETLHILIFASVDVSFGVTRRVCLRLFASIDFNDHVMMCDFTQARYVVRLSTGKKLVLFRLPTIDKSSLKSNDRMRATDTRRHTPSPRCRLRSRPLGHRHAGILPPWSPASVSRPVRSPWMCAASPLRWISPSRTGILLGLLVPRTRDDIRRVLDVD